MGYLSSGVLTLEDFQVTGLWAPCLGYLDACGAGADNSALLAVDGDLFVGPEGGMMNDAFEFLDTGPVRDVAFGGEAGADDEVLGFGGATVCGLDVPASFLGVELGVNDNTFEGGLTFDVEDSVARVEVIAEIVIVGVVVRPVVSLDDLGNTQLILWNFRVDHGARVAIPTPGPA